MKEIYAVISRAFQRYASRSQSLELGNITVSNIKQNLSWAFTYITDLFPTAAGVLIPICGTSMFEWLPILAGGAMAMSSVHVHVVGNSILLGK